VIPVYSLLLVCFYHYQVHTRPRVQRASGVPHALFGRKIHQRLGRIARRGRERASANRTPSFRGEAKHRTRNLEIPRCAIAHLRSGPADHPGMTESGLIRCARNDGLCSLKIESRIFVGWAKRSVPASSHCAVGTAQARLCPPYETSLLQRRAAAPEIQTAATDRTIRRCSPALCVAPRPPSGRDKRRDNRAPCGVR